MAQLLTSELTSLGVEARRKHPEIKQATDAVLARLKSEPDAFLASSRYDHSPPSDHPLLRPVLLSCETKLPKVISLAMALLQRILLQKLIPDDAVPTIVATLNKLLTPPSRSDVDVQLKILQIASALLSSYPNLHNADLSNTLMLGFKLHEGSKVAVVSSTAAATLRQSVMAVFDKVKEEDAILDGIKGGGEEAAASAPLAAMSVDLPDGPVTLFPSSRDAYLVFSDLCALANAEPPSFLSLDSLSKTFSLELIESVLSNHQRLFSSSTSPKSPVNSHPELLFLLRSKVCPLLIKSLSEPPAFPIHLRLMRLLFLLLRQFSADLVLEVEILLSILLRTINPSAQELAAHGGSQPLLWQQVLALEVLRSLCSDDVFLRNLWLWYDSGKADDRSRGPVPVFSKFVETLQNVLLQGESLFAHEASMQSTSENAAVPDSPRRSRIRPSTDRSLSGLYEAAAGVASAAMSGLSGLSGTVGTESLSSSSSPPVQIIDQLDKIEAPSVTSAALPKTYPQLLALQSCHFLTQSMALYALPLYSRFVNSRPKHAAPAPPAMQDTDIDGITNTAERDGLRLTKAMLRTSALPLSDVLTRYLRIKCTDSIFEETLLALRNLTNVTGALELVHERDVVLTSFITFAVPGWDAAAPFAVSRATGGDLVQMRKMSNRNLACLRAFVQVAYYLSGALGPFWYPVLSGLCSAQALLVSMSASTPASDDSGKEELLDEDAAGRNGRATLSTLTHNSMMALDTRSGRSQLQLLNMADLQPNRLQAQIQSVFENTASLEDNAFLHFISSLCRLSGDIMQSSPQSAPSASTESEISSPRGSGFKGRASTSRAEFAATFYPITCLELVASLNTRRLCLLPSDQGWEVVTSHLISTLSNSQLPPAWRSQASKVANKLSYGAMSEAAEISDESEKLRLQKQALQILSSAGVLDGRRATAVDMEVRTTSVENLNKMLETFGHSLVYGWEIIFDICSATCKNDKRSAETVLPSSASAQKVQLALIKAGFSCLQLVCSDFLAALDLEQIRRCCSCLNDFGSQDLDVNVALTANGCLWGLTAEMAARAKAKSADVKMASVDANAQPLWLFLLQCLLSISQSPRSEVRNGAISNLFRVLQQYGDMLNPQAWQEIVDTIIFPLVKLLDASISDLESGAAIETAKQDRQAQLMGALPSELKQWQESQSLALTQFGEAVRSYLPSKLIFSRDFEGMWARLLELTRRTFLQGPADLSQASIKCFTSALSANVEEEAQLGDASRTKIQSAWQKAWESWIVIGEHMRQTGSQQSEADARKSDDAGNGDDARPFRFTQKNLLAYIQVFPQLHRVLQASFDQARVETLLTCLKGCLSYPHSPDYMSDRASLTNVQEAARATARSVADVKNVPALILSDLSECICLAFAGTDLNNVNKIKNTPTFVALSRASIAEAFSVFVTHENDASIYTEGAFESLLSALIIPIKLKYDCPDSPNASSKTERKVDARPVWQLATLTLCRVLSRCCPKLHTKAAKGQLDLGTVERLWTKIVDAIQAAVLADSSAASSMPPSVKDFDERFSLYLLSTIERFVLPHLGEGEVPDHLIEQVGRTLAHGSKLYSFETESSGGDRSGWVGDPVEATNERFAYWCFDLLFLGCSSEFGTADSKTSVDSEAHRRLATALLTHLISRCEEVFLSFARDLQIRGMIPMHRIRQEELNYVIQRYLELQLWPETYSASARGQQSSARVASWHKSERAHLFSAFRHLLLLVSIQQPSAGSGSELASIGTSLPPIVSTDTAELAKTFVEHGLELGIIGTTRDILGAGCGTDVTIKAAPRELTAKALALVGDDLGVVALPI
ncbi:related to MON2 - peripheral membrane protein with a role in endocytosis and vacuole integrity [Ustilago trichophora]|uniref:Related to MON2 - peripheral membrane protein with a role in endocytosis and vacuole integrity n=1 Tax=Ustilago trichophora TaxID=86804 RepID=A0A5C3DRY0_9BASI|nr:related to MON2 - peripheral membrane protein with a role in endocytosis and vacuole integrity [Ustilago trichophora]